MYYPKITIDENELKSIINFLISEKENMGRPHDTIEIFESKGNTSLLIKSGKGNDRIKLAITSKKTSKNKVVINE